MLGQVSPARDARGHPKRIELADANAVAHFENRVEAMIVCMIRRICVELYDALIKLRPELRCPSQVSEVMNF